MLAAVAVVFVGNQLLALAQQTGDRTVLGFTPILDGEDVVTSVGRQVSVIECPALFERQVDEVGLGQARTIGATTVADEGRQLGVDVQVDDGFAHALGLVIVGSDDDFVEDRVEPALTNLVLLCLAIADGDGDHEEVVVRATENGSGIGEELGLTEERRVADVFADQGDFAAATQLLLFAEFGVRSNHRSREAVALEAVDVRAAEVDFAKRGDGVLLVETAHSHEKTKALDGAVEVGLALEDRSVNVNEESSHLAVAGAEIAAGHRAFAGHSDLPVDTRNARFSQGCTSTV